MGRADITETADGGFMCIMRKPSSLPPNDGDKRMKANEKIVDAGKGFQKMKEATRRVLAVSKDELERREAAWREKRVSSRAPEKPS